MTGWAWLMEPRILHWDDAFQCELGGRVAAMLAMTDHARNHEVPR